MIKTLVCADCRVEFSYDHLTGPTRHRCPACTLNRKHQTDSAKAKRWRSANPDRAREQWNRHNRRRLADPEYVVRKRWDRVLRSYGLTQSQFQELVADQGGRCAICSGDRCGRGDRLHIDHCHTTNKIRGLLCARCNTAVGLLGDDPERAEKLAAYLRR